MSNENIQCHHGDHMITWAPITQLIPAQSRLDNRDWYCGYSQSPSSKNGENKYLWGVRSCSASSSSSSSQTSNHTISVIKEYSAQTGLNILEMYSGAVRELTAIVTTSTPV